MTSTTPHLPTSFRSILCEKLEGDLDEVEKRLHRFNNVFYLTDNSGEVIFDLFVIERLLEMGLHVVIGSKSEPILNDVTAEELRGITDVKVISTGPVVGTALEFLSPEAAELLFHEDWLVISKGMGNFETMSEFDERLQGRLIYVLRAKCEPVAMQMRCSKGNTGGKICIARYMKSILISSIVHVYFFQRNFLRFIHLWFRQGYIHI